jgi:hypothetical protein
MDRGATSEPSSRGGARDRQSNCGDSRVHTDKAIMEFVGLSAQRRRLGLRIDRAAACVIEAIREAVAAAAMKPRRARA